MASIEKRITQDNQTTFRVKIRLKGFSTQTATFERLTDAKRWAQQTEAAIREGRHFKTAESKKHTFAEAVNRYIKHIFSNKPKSKIDQSIQLNWWKESLGNYVLADVTPSLIAQQREKLAEGLTVKKTPRTPATANRYLSA